MVGFLWLIYFLMQGLVLYGEPVVNSYMIVHTGMTRATLGAGTSLFMLLQGFSGPFVGRAIQKRGIRFTIILGAILVAVSSILMGTVVNTPWEYLVSFGIISGVGIGFSGMFSVQSGITYWFREKRALAMAIALTGAGLGGFVAGNVINKIIAATGDWRMAWHFITITSIVTIVITALFIVNRPESIGQVPDGDVSDNSEKPKIKPFSRVYKTTIDTPLAVVLKDYRVWFIIIALVAIRFTYSMCIAHAILHLFDKGIPQGIAATAVGTMTLFSVLGRLGAGALGDKIEPRLVWIGGMLIFIIGFLNLMFATTAAQAIIFSIFVGMGFGASYVCSAAMIGNYYGVNTFPAVMGIVFPFQMIMGALAPISAGVIFDLTKSYTMAFMIGLVVIIIGTLALLRTTPPKKEIVPEHNLAV